MTSLRFAFAAFALCGASALSLAPAQAQAQEQAAQQVAPVYFDLFQAMEESVDQEVATDIAMDAVAREFAATPAFAEFERRSPGFINEVVTGMRPIVDEHSDYVREVYAPRMAALFAEHLTEEEAAIAARFYRSDAGKRLMSRASRNLTFDSVLSDLDSSEGATEEQVTRDMNSSVGSTMAEMPREELEELGRIFMEEPALMKIGGMQGDILALRTQMENEPMPPALEKRIQNMMEDVFKRRFPDGL